MPELAYEAVRIEVTLEQGKNMDFPMYVASRNEVSQVIHIAWPQKSLGRSWKADAQDPSVWYMREIIR